MLGKWLAGDDLDYRFTGELQPLGDLVEGASPRRRMAAVGIALDLAEFGRGKRNRYKQAHFDHLMLDIEDLLTKTEAKLQAAFGELKLAGFHAGDWLEQLQFALDEKATVVTFPPFYKAGYENLYKWLDANVEWANPVYPMFDPANLQVTVDQIVASDIGFVIGSGKLLDRPEPKSLFTPITGTPHYLYARDGDARLIRPKANLKPFKFEPLDLAKLTADSKVELRKVDGGRAMYVRNMFLKKSIKPAPGRWNYLIYLDGMLAGVLVYDPSKFGPRPDCIYLLSDVSVSREAKVSKLISRLATNQVVIGDIAARALAKMSYVVTTAFSDHPVSMKYRGIFELLSRKEAEAPATGFQLQYGSEVRGETPQDAYSWWWSTHVSQASAVERQGNGRSSGRAGGRGR